MGETVRYAGFWRRVGATIIDNLLLAIVLYPLVRFFTSGEFFLDTETSSLMAKLASIDWVYLLINEGLPALLVIFLWVRFETTPGKYMFDCYVVDARTFGPLSIRQAILRYVGYLVSFLTLCIGFLWVAFDKRKRGFHDMIAGSVVIVRINGPFDNDESKKSLEQLMKESS
jgi:uncharacterized RDD family membrane protein YckC